MQVDLFENEAECESVNSLRIDLFKDDLIIRNLSRSLGKLRSNPPNPVDVNIVKETLKKNKPEFEACAHNLCNLPRHYSDILGIEFKDSHYLIEKYGLSKSSKDVIITYDLSNYLDLIICIITKSDPKKVRTMMNYSSTSKALLNTEFENFNLPLKNFSNLDNNLSEYLVKLFYSSGESFALSSFLSSILMAVVNVVGYLGIALQKTYDCSLRSMNGPTGVLTGYSKLPIDSVLLVYGDKWEFNIPLIQEYKEEMI